VTPHHQSGGLADVERDLIRTRTAQGPQPGAEARAAMGRKPKLTAEEKAEARRRRAEGAKNSRAAPAPSPTFNEN
jgi:hypothetical protein